MFHLPGSVQGVILNPLGWGWFAMTWAWLVWTSSRRPRLWRIGCCRENSSLLAVGVCCWWWWWWLHLKNHFSFNILSWCALQTFISLSSSTTIFPSSSFTQLDPTTSVFIAWPPYKHFLFHPLSQILTKLLPVIIFCLKESYLSLIVVLPSGFHALIASRFSLSLPSYTIFALLFFYICILFCTT